MSTAAAFATAGEGGTGICLLAWKRRSGLMGGKLLPADRRWEQRWIVVSGSSLMYYRLGEEDGIPRGSIDLIKQKTVVQVTAKSTPDAPTPHEVDVVVTSELLLPLLDDNKEGNSSHSQNSNSDNNNKKHNNKIQWKLCFDTQLDLMQFLKVVHDILQNTGQLKEKDSSRFEHDFQQSDHIYRWEMIWIPPIIYPIQIHGIVLEAGRNCIVVADFGLTGYSGKAVEGRDFNHMEDRHTQNMILAAWRKMHPTNQDQRLNIMTLTDPIDIRKWCKAHYDEHNRMLMAPVDKIQKLTKFFSKLKKKTNTASSSNSHDHHVHDHDADDTSSSHNTTEGELLSLDSSTGSNKRSSGEHREQRQQQQEHLLPKSDPKEIVLARANFLLEHGEQILPPYHVFYSNSECIAVWCKTGRWSTLQTAVFLSSTSVGNAKSTIATTLGVAAAHAILAPVVAIGGLVCVTAPMVILQKSREKWEEATKLLTDEFWSYAPPLVYVSAIENWSCLGHRTNYHPMDDRDNNKAAEKQMTVNTDKQEV